MNQENLAMLERALEHLGELAGDVVFVGGATVDLWITDEAAPEFRASRSGRYGACMAHDSKPEIERRRAAAERMRGLFADVAPDRSLVDELIADHRAEAVAEDRGSR